MPPYEQESRQNPLVVEAHNIAQLALHGDQYQATIRLQSDLYSLQGYPGAQRELTALVGQYEHPRQHIQHTAERTANRTYHQEAHGSRARSSNENFHAQTNLYSWAGMASNGNPGGQNYYRSAQNRYPTYEQHQASNGYERVSNPIPSSHNFSSSAEHHRQMWLAPDATRALLWAESMAERHGVHIEVTSAGRSFAEQARLYQELHGRSPVAPPGSSSHEAGLAIDVKNYRQAQPYLVAAGFVHGDGSGPLPGDPWHFRYMGA